MSQQQITVESGEVVKHAEFVPCIGTENITAAVEEPVGYIFAYIRNKERDDPDKQEYLLGFVACPLYPCREERHIEV
jgi:hypothetical protein